MQIQNEGVLKEDRERVKASLRKIFYAPTYEHAKEAVEIFKRNWGRKYPAALECLLKDIELYLTYYRYPYILIGIGMEANKDDQCSGEELQGGATEDKRYWEI